MGISSKMSIWVMVILGLISIGSVNVKAQSAAPAPGPGTSGVPDCMTAVYNMSDCLTYVEKNSNLVKPDKNCCPEIAGMLDSNPICLCQMLGKSKDFGIELDMERALKLPSVCKLQAPDPSLCSAIGIPTGAPAGGPAGGPSSSGGLSTDGPSLGAPAGGPSSSGGLSTDGPSLGPSSSSSPADAMSPEGGEAKAKKNEASSAQLSVATILVGGLAVAYTLLKL